MRKFKIAFLHRSELKGEFSYKLLVKREFDVSLPVEVEVNCELSDDNLYETEFLKLLDKSQFSDTEKEKIIKIQNDDYKKKYFLELRSARLHFMKHGFFLDNTSYPLDKQTGKPYLFIWDFIIPKQRYDGRPGADSLCRMDWTNFDIKNLFQAEKNDPTIVSVVITEYIVSLFPGKEDMGLPARQIFEFFESSKFGEPQDVRRRSRSAKSYRAHLKESAKSL